MEPEKFCLRWNEYESNLGTALRDLRDSNDFFDLTLACDDAQEIQVHRVILSACSSFFRNILRRLPHHHPLVYLRGIKLADLQSVVTFMYHGEVNVAQEDLNAFLILAEDLKIKGLTQCHGEAAAAMHKRGHLHSAPKVATTSVSCPPLKPAPLPLSRRSPSLSSQTNSIRHQQLPSSSVPRLAATSSSNCVAAANNINNTDTISIKTEVTSREDEDISDSPGRRSYRCSPDAELEPEPAHISSPHTDFTLGVPPLTIGVTEGNKVEVLIKEESIESLNPDDELELLGDMYKCRLCYKSLDCLDTAKNHILAHFALPGGLTCLQCGLSFNSKVLFSVHMSSEHRNIKKW